MYRLITGRKFWVIPLVLACTIFIAGCSLPFTIEMKKGDSKDGDSKSKKSKPAQVIIPVEAEAANIGKIADYFITYSKVEAETKVEIFAEGSETALQVMVDEGDTVTRGQALVELDKQAVTANLQQAKSQLKQNEADYDRAKKGFASGLNSQAEYDAAFFSFEQSKENLRTQEVQLANMTVRAPFDGVITTRHVQPGTLVGSGVACFTIIDPSSYVLPVDVPETALPRLFVGQQAQVTIDSLGGQELRASVRRVNPAIGESGMVKVLLDFDEDTQSLLRDMAFARIRLVMDTHENALLIPKDALLEENGRQYVYVVRATEETPEEEDAESGDEESSDGKEVLADSKDADKVSGPPLMAEQVEVEVGLSDSNFVEIVSGLTTEDLLVTNGQHTLQDKSRLRVTNATTEIMSKAGLTPGEALEAAKLNETGDGQSKKSGRSSKMRGGFRH